MRNTYRNDRPSANENRLTWVPRVRSLQPCRAPALLQTAQQWHPSERRAGTGLASGPKRGIMAGMTRNESITRREFIRQAGAHLAGMYMAGSALAAAGPADRPIRWHVLLISSDQHNPKIMGCDGAIQTTVRTPHMDRMAREGTLFTRAYCAFPVCAPTRSSLVTGQYPQRHGQISNEAKLVTAGPKGAAPSLAHCFRAAGYNTALMGKTHSNNQTRDSRPDDEQFMGFDYRMEKCCDSDGIGGAFIPSKEVMQARRDEYRKAHPVSGGARRGAWEQDIWDRANEIEKWEGVKRFNGRPANHPADLWDGVHYYDALAYLDAFSTGRGTKAFALNNSNPFFLYVSFTQPHWPWVSPRMQDGMDFYSMYDGSGSGRGGLAVDMPAPETMKFDFSQYYGAAWQQKRYNWAKLDPAVTRLARARYYGSVSWIDHMLGGLMDRLAKLDDPVNPGRKLSETTIVAYTSDHGDMLGEKGHWFKYILFDGAARVPLILKAPGLVPAGVRSPILANHVDLLPTLAGLAGIGGKLPKGLAGQDLSAAVKANDASAGPERTISVLGIRKDLSQHPGAVMTRTARYKFIRESNKGPDGRHNIVLFDMDADPHETTNVAHDPNMREVVARENAAIDAFLARFKA